MSDSTQNQQRARLRRDGQQWLLDKALKETGRVFHFQHSARGRIPESVKTHDQISKHLGKKAQRLHAVAKSEEAAGHAVTAMEFYFDAATAYAHAQHTIFTLDEEKVWLHGRVLECYDAVRRLSPRKIERVDVEWEGTVVSGYLHLADVEGPAPLIFHIVGCDMTKEMVPHPLYNFVNQRDMHVFVFDGPGQGESNMRGIKLTSDNYEAAASAALTALIARPDVDEDRIGLFALSFGSYWGARFAATDHRIAATALVWASICDKYYMFEVESPRYKQLFAFLTGLETEDELDEFVVDMDLTDLMTKIEGPTLVTAGEFDPRSPINEVYELFDSMTAPAELWVFADQFHGSNVKGSNANQWCGDHNSLATDWLADRLAGKPIKDPGGTLYLESNGVGPNDDRAAKKRQWFGV